MNKQDQEIKIENKPNYCHAWTAKNSCNVMCNSIPCCGYYIHGRTDRVTDGFTAIDQIGRNQAPYYNDLRKKDAEKKNK